MASLVRPTSGLRRSTVAAAIAVGVLLAGCGGEEADAPTTPPAATDTDEPTAPPAATDTDDDASDPAIIVISSFTFNGPESVPVGTTIEIRNNDSAPHSWTSPDGVFDSGTLAMGDSFEFTFDEAGEYEFFCEIHPSMTGSITVTD